MKHYHVYLAMPEYPTRALMTRTTDVFRTKAAAFNWARSWPSDYRIVRQCEGGRGCTGSEIPRHGERPPLPAYRRRKPRKRRPAALRRLEARLADHDAEAWAHVAEALDAWESARDAAPAPEADAPAAELAEAACGVCGESVADASAAGWFDLPDSDRVRACAECLDAVAS